MDSETIVKSIKDLCKKHGITANQLEINVGLSQGLISRWTKTMPSLDKIIDIANYFNVSIDEVVGRVQSKDNKDKAIVSALANMTTKGELTWESVDDYKNYTINNISFEELFHIYKNEEVEIYKCKYNKSTIFLVALYDVDYGSIDYLDIKLYLQPDDNSMPVVQETHKKSMQDFWINIRKPFRSIPDEWKANDVKKQIISDNEQALINNYLTYFETASESDVTIDNFLSDEKAKQILVETDIPELQQLIDIFTNPKMTQAMNSAQRLIAYFNNIKDIKEDK